MKDHPASVITDSNSIKVCYINARSLRNKFSDLEELVATENYHIIGVTESWLNTEQRDFIAEFKLPGFSIFSCERENRIGGGVILYVRNSLHPFAVKKEIISKVDVVFVEIRNNSSK